MKYEVDQKTAQWAWETFGWRMRSQDVLVVETAGQLEIRAADLASILRDNLVDEPDTVLFAAASLDEVPLKLARVYVELANALPRDRDLDAAAAALRTAAAGYIPVAHASRACLSRLKSADRLGLLLADREAHPRRREVPQE